MLNAWEGRWRPALEQAQRAFEVDASFEDLAEVARALGRVLSPHTQQPSQGGPEKRSLGHCHKTDLLSVAFQGPLNLDTVDEEVRQSLLHALLEGASATLEISRDDIRGTVFLPTPPPRRSLDSRRRRNTHMQPPRPPHSGPPQPDPSLPGAAPPNAHGQFRPPGPPHPHPPQQPPRPPHAGPPQPGPPYTGSPLPHKPRRSRAILVFSLVSGLILVGTLITVLAWPSQEDREDKAYLTMLLDHPSASWWDGHSDTGMVNRGRQVCRDLDEGRALASIAVEQEVLAVGNPPHQAALRHMTEAAITIYCPQHMDEFLGHT